MIKTIHSPSFKGIQQEYNKINKLDIGHSTRSAITTKDSSDLLLLIELALNIRKIKSVTDIKTFVDIHGHTFLHLGNDYITIKNNSLIVRQPDDYKPNITETIINIDDADSVFKAIYKPLEKYVSLAIGEVQTTINSHQSDAIIILNEASLSVHDALSKNAPEINTYMDNLSSQVSTALEKLRINEALSGMIDSIKAHAPDAKDLINKTAKIIQNNKNVLDAAVNFAHQLIPLANCLFMNKPNKDIQANDQKVPVDNNTQEPPEELQPKTANLQTLKQTAETVDSAILLALQIAKAKKES